MFCWEAFSLISFNRADIRREIKGYERLVDANIVFTYTQKSDPGISEEDAHTGEAASVRKKEAFNTQKPAD